ncbi:MAG: hypothetical protein RL082_963, partial [Pseudomonadota bacterium]
MGRPTISVNILPWEQAHSQAYPIRLAVFVKEQGVPEEIKQLLLEQHLTPQLGSPRQIAD